MNDSLYEDYMRGVLGYQGMNSYPNTYNMSYDNYERYDPYAVHTMSPIASNQPTTAMSNIQMQELEKYLQELSSDIVEMIQYASPEEKSFMAQKISALATKINV